jgi:hypothetical protein
MDRHDQAQWQCPAGEVAVEADTKAAAEWLAGRLSRNGKAISRLIIDTDGGVCSWVSTSETNDTVLRAIIERRFDEGDSAHGSRFPELPGETVLQPLSVPEATKDKGPKAQRQPSRVMVASMPVVPARLLMDHLDRLGIRVHAVEALWQAMAQAWDPSMAATLGPAHADRVIADTQPVVAVILLDPAGRLVWSWSHAGRWLAGGALRVPTRRHDERAIEHASAPASQPMPVISAADIGRLGADWLAWSMQIGCLPARTIIIGEPADDGDALSAPALAAALRRSIPDTAVDFIREPDPVGATLAKLADRDRALDAGLSDLTNRPGRSHRAMYRWSALALLGAAGLLGASAWKIWNTASGYAAQGRQIDNDYVTLVKEQDLPLPTALLDLDRQITALKQSRVDLSSVIQPPRPILAELEALSLVLASDEITLKELSVTAVSVSIKADVADTRTFEELNQAIRSVAGSSIASGSWRTNVVQRGSRVECTFTGTWPEREGGN